MVEGRATFLVVRTAILLILLSSTAHAQHPTDGLYVESPAGTQVLQLSGGAVRTVATAFRVRRVASIDNSNRTFRLHVETTKAGKRGKGSRAYLVEARKVVQGSGATTDSHSWYVFDVDAAVARRFAKTHNQQVRLRKDISKHVDCRFRTTKQSFHLGENIPITIDVWRKGSRKVSIVVGGKTRGARNDRFRFAVVQKGKQLAIESAHNFGGRATEQELGTRSKPISVTAKLSGWVSLAQTGRYVVRLRSSRGSLPSRAVAERWT